WDIMKDEVGAVFTITLPSASRPMGSWWPNGAVFPPPLVPATWTYPSPNGHATSVLGVRPVRVERHNPLVHRHPSTNHCQSFAPATLGVSFLWRSFYNTQ